MTIQEIAKLAGVSPATVSRVFSHHPGIGGELRQKVLEISRKNGYHPRISDRRKNVVVVTPYDSVFPVQSCVDMILSALTREFPRRGFRLEILPVNNLVRLESVQFCAAVAIGVEAADFPDWAERFPVPLVMMDRAPGEKRTPGVSFIRSDEAQGMAKALEYLHGRGCRKVGSIIHGTPERGNARLRYEAIVETQKRIGLPDDPLLTCYSGDGNEKYVELIGRLLKRGIDALFCPGGNAGIVALYALSLYNRSVPGDISLIASEQTFFSRFGVPPQTTISPDYPGMARSVADELERWLDSGRVSSGVVLPYELTIRESVR